MYDIIGGQHSLEACKIMIAKKPDDDNFKARYCQIYYAPALSYDAKKYLGIIHNRIGDCRWTDSTREQVYKAVYSL